MHSNPAGAALDLLKTQIENQPKSSQSNRQKPEITSQAYQSRVLRSLQLETREYTAQARRIIKAAQNGRLQSINGSSNPPPLPEPRPTVLDTISHAHRLRAG